MIEESVSLEGFKLLDPAVQQCPHLYYEKMREEHPVCTQLKWREFQ